MAKNKKNAAKPDGQWNEAYWTGILSNYKVPEPKAGFVDRVLEEKRFQDLLQERKVPEPSEGFVQETFAKVLRDRQTKTPQDNPLPHALGRAPQRTASLFHPRTLVFAAAVAAILVLTLILRGRPSSQMIPEGKPMEVAERLISPDAFPKYGSNPFSRVLASRNASILPPPPVFVDFEDQ